MAQPDISQILAALRPGGTPVQATPQQPPPMNQGYAQSYGGPPQQPNTAPYSLPQPISSGNVDLSNIRPLNSGSLSLSEAAEKERSYGGGKAGFYDEGRNGYGDRDIRRQPRSRSRSRSPHRGNRDRDMFRNNYNPYIDERREDQRHVAGGRAYRDRSFSPGITSLPPRPVPSGQYGFKMEGMSQGSPDEQGTDVIMVDSNLVGLIIGRAGENLRRVEADTSTRVQFMAAGPDGTSPQRTCKITGTRTARDHAKAEISRIIQENGRDRGIQDRAQSTMATAKPAGSQQPALRSGEDSTQMMVPNRTVGLIIGRGGETIRDLQDRSGCHVNIVSEEKSINGLRPVNLIGTKEAAAVAKELILEIVDSDNKSLAQAGQSGQTNPKSNLGAAPAAAESSNERINDSMMVPSEAVGMIIGKGGETIKDMQNVTACKINVSQPSGRDIEREIGLIGTRSAIEYAKHAIMEKVRAVEEKNKGGGRQSTAQYDRLGTNQQIYASDYDQRQPQYGHQSSNQSAYQSAPQQGQPADPYEAYGGYDNYMAMWSAYYQNQSQAQPGSGPPPS